METSVKAAEVLVPPQPDVASSTTRAEEAAPPASIGSSDPFDPMVEMSRRLEDIISTYGSANQDTQSLVEKEPRKEAARDDVIMETEVSAVIQSLDKFSSPEDKLGALVRKYSELAALRRLDEKKLSVLQAESRSSVAARGKLEALCRELQRHYNTLRDEAIQSCREDEQKRSEMANHFQTKLTEIQDQIEQHNARNDKLCSENLNLTDKLESLMNQCELREESLDKINKHRDLQHKLTEAKLQQANALLAEAEEKHKREKEYLLREAIDKTKKCFAMKEQELTMKKKLLVQAAEWKLQAQTLKEQDTVMHRQLALYAQKFDEFQETLAKSNQIYAHFKKEMEKMSDKMKKLEIESDLWKTRFENCNKALTDMIEERTEKSKEYEVFVLKIQKLEKLCRALQEERVVLYDKIKEVRQASGPSKELSPPGPEDVDQSALLSPSEIQEIQDEDPVLTKDMTRLREEQAKLQEFAASLWDSPVDEEEEVQAREEPKEDVVVSAFAQFRSRGPQQAADPEPQDPEPGAAKVQTQVEDKEEPAAQQSPAEPAPAEPEEAQTSPEDLKVQAEAAKPESAPPTAPELAPPTAPESAPPTATELAPPTAPESAPPTAPVSAPPTAPELAPPTAPESAPPIVPVSAPPTAPESAPPTVPVSAPPTAPVSAPPTVPVSAPPSATESAPPTAPPTAPPATASSSDSSKKQTPKKKKRRNHKS